jgi:hypothetical protein
MKPLEIVLAEYKRWRDWQPIDHDSDMIALGALGACGNIVAAMTCGTPDVEDVRSLTHYSRRPGVAFCGADEPNQKTTQILTNTTCEACLSCITRRLEELP